MRGKRLLPAVLLLLVAIAPAVAQEKMLEPEDFYKSTSVGSPAVSADGKWIAYSVSRFNPETDSRDSDIYLIPIAGGESRRLTAVSGSERGYTWHPSEPLLAFSAGRGGRDEGSQIYVIDIRGGEARQVTDIKSGAYSPAWSPDGKMIAFYSSVTEAAVEKANEPYGDVHYAKNLRYFHLGPGWDEGKRQRIFVVPAEGGEERQLTKHWPVADEGDHSMAWSPDSKEIAFVSNREKEWWNTIDTNIYAVNVESGEVREVSNNIGPDHDPAYSPDGNYLAWRASFEYNYESEDYKLMVAPLSGATEPKVFGAELDRNIGDFQWTDDSSRIYFSVASEGYRHIHYLDIAKPGEYPQVTDGDRQIRGWRHMDDGSFVMLASTSTTPSDIFTFANGEWKQLTTAAAEWWEEYPLSPSEELWITAADGTKAQGWLIKPIGYEEGKRYPLILSIHGGPHGMYGPALRFEYQMLAQRGYAVLYTNPRGSAGYGQAFADVIHEDWNTAPFADLMSFVDKVVDMGVADPEALGVTGGSYGGYMTNWVIGNTSRFAAAVTVAGLSNMVSFFGTTDEQFFPEKEMEGVPWTKKEVYLFNSPVWHADKFTTPTMVIHGGNDWRVRPEQGRQLFTALQKVGVPSVYVEFPGEQHGVGGRTHRTLYYKLKLDWFGHWLRGEDVGIAPYITPSKYVYPPQPPAE